MFGISGEHLLILGVILLVLGPRRLPELGNSMGKAIRNFKDAISGVEEASFRKVEAQKEKDPAAPSSAAATAPLQENEKTVSVEPDSGSKSNNG